GTGSATESVEVRVAHSCPGAPTVTGSSAAPPRTLTLSAPASQRQPWAPACAGSASASTASSARTIETDGVRADVEMAASNAHIGLEASDFTHPGPHGLKSARPRPTTVAESPAVGAPWCDPFS